MDSFSEKLPSIPESSNIIYLTKRGGKRGIESELDLTSVYKQFDNGEPKTLYYETKSSGLDTRRKRKSPTELESDILEDSETEVKKAADKLKKVHGVETYN